MTTQTLIALAGALVSLVGAGLAVAVSWGRMGGALADVRDEVAKVRGTLERWGERLGGVEGDVKVLQDRTQARPRHQTLSGR